MKNLKKWFALSLIIILGISTIGGCSSKASDEAGNDDTQQSTGTNDSGTTTKDSDGDSASVSDDSNQGGLVFQELPDNTLSITVAIPNFGTAPEGTLVQQEWQKRMEEYLGCTLDITWNMTPWLDFRGNEKVLLQAGDIPDISTYSQSVFVNEYGSDGIVLDINQYKDYMQYYPEFVKETNGGDAYASNDDGSAYYFMDGFVNPEDNTGAQSFTAYAYRFDILQKFNLLPATTLDEFTQLCADIKDLIDQGEIDANYVMTNSDKNYSFYRGFVGSYHTWDTTYWNGDKWSFGPIEDNFREMLKYLNSLYEAGYIDPEFATDDGTACTEKAVTGKSVIYPTLWAGMARMWNVQTSIDGLQWGLAYLPENSDYGTPWKWGSKQDGRSLQNAMGIIISADTEYPEWVVRMIDYQYSDEMVELMNWGIEGQTYTMTEDGNHSFSDEILNSDDPVQEAANYGIMSSSACRTGIPFTPLTFEAMTEQIPNEPWWSSDEGYYEGQYWIESGKIGGAASVSPFDRPPVLNLSDEEATAKAELTTNCETYAKENALKFITGDWDANDDDDWQNYIKGVKSQISDFDGTLEMLLNKSDLSSIGQ